MRDDDSAIHHRRPVNVGPIQLVVIQRKADYCTRIWNSITIEICNLMIGAVNMMVLFYSAVSTDFHAIICCIAFHLCTLEAILMFNIYNGAAKVLKVKHRKIGHLILQILSIILAGIATVIVVINRETNEFRFHGIIGLVTTILAMMTALIGIGAFVNSSKKRYFRLAHVIFGVPTFISGTVTIVSGLIKDVFRKWAGGTMLAVTVAFLIVTTTYVFVTTFLKCMRLMQR